MKKNTNSTQNKFQTHRAKQYEVTSFLSTDCELSTETCSKNVYSLGPWMSRGSTPSRRMSTDTVFRQVFLDRRLPLHHQPSICLHPIGIVLSLHMSTPPRSATSHHILNRLNYAITSSIASTMQSHPQSPQLCNHILNRLNYAITSSIASTASTMQVCSLSQFSLSLTNTHHYLCPYIFDSMNTN